MDKRFHSGSSTLKCINGSLLTEVQDECKDKYARTYCINFYQ